MVGAQHYSCSSTTRDSILYVYLIRSWNDTGNGKLNGDDKYIPTI